MTFKIDYSSKRIQNPDCWFYFIVIFYSLFALSLIGEGACALPDESRYWYSANFVYYLSEFKISNAFEQLFFEGGRPGLILVQLPSVILQSFFYLIFNFDPRSIDSLWVPQLINIFISVLILGFIYMLSVRLFAMSKWMALSICVFYILLPSSVLYIRHLLPYNYSLLAYLICLYCISKKLNPFTIGILSGFTFSIYIGHSVLLLILIVALMHNNTREVSDDNPTKTLQKLIVFLLGIIFVILTYELMARLIGLSYFFNIGTAVDAFAYECSLRYDSTLVFLVNSFYGVDGWAAVFYGLALIVILVIITNKLLHNRKLELIEKLLLTLSTAIAVQSLIGFLFDVKVFYWRQFYAYVIFLVVALFTLINQSSYKFKIAFAFCGIIMLNFVLFIDQYSQIAYPRDLYNDLQLNSNDEGKDYNIKSIINKDKNHKYLFDFEPNNYFNFPPQGIVKTDCFNSNDTNLIFVNMSSIPNNVKLNNISMMNVSQRNNVFLHHHYNSLQAYWYDEDWISRRQMFMHNNVLIGVFK